MAAFPTTVATDADLYIAVNATSTQLTDNPLTIGATTVNVVSTTAFPTVGFISIDNEIIKYTGKTATSFTGCTRGADGTAASSHVQNSQVFHNVIAAHHNVLKDDLIATEQFISDLIGRTNTQIRAPDGSAALPSYSFANDTNSGLFRVSADRIQLVTNGSARIDINDSANYVYLLGQTRHDDGTAALPSVTFNSDTDTGMYRIGANSIGFSTNAGLALSIDANNTSIERGQLFLTAGSAASPSLTFAGASGTGLYRTGSDLAITVGGTIRFSVDNTSGFIRSQTTAGLQAGFGSAATPSFGFVGDEDTGIYRAGANQVAVSTNGVARWSVSDTAIEFNLPHRGQDGTAASPTYSFANDTDCGMFRVGTNQFGFSANGVRIALLNENAFTGARVGATANAGYVGSPQGTTTVNNTTYVYNLGSVKVFTVEIANGDGAFCYTNFLSGTITVLGSSGNIVNSSTPASNQLGVFKSASSHDISVKTGTSASSTFGSWAICFVGTSVNTIP